MAFQVVFEKLGLQRILEGSAAGFILIGFSECEDVGDDGSLIVVVGHQLCRIQREELESSLPLMQLRLTSGVADQGCVDARKTQRQLLQLYLQRRPRPSFLEVQRPGPTYGQFGKRRLRVLLL